MEGSQFSHSPEQSYPIPNNTQTLMALAWVLTIISSLTVITRLMAKIQRMAAGWDDFFVLLSMVSHLTLRKMKSIVNSFKLCFFGISICITILNVVVPLEFSIAQRVNRAGQVFGYMGVGAGKVSIAALLLGIIKNASKKVWQRVYLWVICTILVFAMRVCCSILVVNLCSLKKDGSMAWCMDPDILVMVCTFTGGRCI